MSMKVKMKERYETEDGLTIAKGSIGTIERDYGRSLLVDFGKPFGDIVLNHLEVEEIDEGEEVGNPARVFESGASRNSDEGKLQKDLFTDANVMHHYAKFMHNNRSTDDGTVRNGDNWKKGIPKDALIASAVRHVEDVRLHHQGYEVSTTEPYLDSIFGAIFNLMGLAHDELNLQKTEDAEPIVTTLNDVFSLGDTVVDNDPEYGKVITVEDDYMVIDWEEAGRVNYYSLGDAIKDCVRVI